jgi:predicted alpha/beta superfamily hydrolase
MKYYILSAILTITCFSLKGQDKEFVTLGTIDVIDSEILNEERSIWVYVPDRGENSFYQEQQYPVVYLLDGDAHFYSVVGMIHQLSSVNGNDFCPKMIVVGIPNTNRTRDLTPTRPSLEHPFVDSAMVSISGGGDTFLSFMRDELFPYIDENYPTLPYRMLIGHSFGGLTAMHAFTYNPDMFNAYVAIDPSMWWDDRKLLNEILETDLRSYNNKSLVIGIANTMNEGMDTAMARVDTSFTTEHIRSILDLHDHMTANSGDGIDYMGKYYHEDSHGSAPLITEYDALRFIFQFYTIRWEMDDFMNPESDLVGKLVAHYKTLSDRFGMEMKPEEQSVNEMGYQFMNMGQMDKAKALFQLNVENYPESFNVHDSLGDYYLAVDDNQKAKECFQRSIDINPESFSGQKLNDLEKE